MLCIIRLLHPQQALILWFFPHLHLLILLLWLIWLQTRLLSLPGMFPGYSHGLFLHFFSTFVHSLSVGPSLVTFRILSNPCPSLILLSISHFFDLFFCPGTDYNLTYYIFYLVSILHLFQPRYIFQEGTGLAV